MHPLRSLAYAWKIWKQRRVLISTRNVGSDHHFCCMVEPSSSHRCRQKVRIALLQGRGSDLTAPKSRSFCDRDCELLTKTQEPLNGGVSNGGVSRSGLVLPFLSFFVLFCPFLSFLGLSRFSRDFPDLLADGPGIFPICPFPLSRPIKSTYEEQSRKGPRHNLDLSRKKWETPGFGNPPA